MRTVFIYALNCPITGRTRYIGKSTNPNRRMASHIANREKNYKSNWVHSLLQRGLKPVLEILDEVPNCEWPMWEVAYIQFFRDEGFDLTNLSVGGDGIDMTPETRAKIGVANSIRVVSPSTREKLRAANSGIRNANFGKFGTPVSQEVREKIGAAHRGKIVSEETRKKLRISQSLRRIREREIASNS